jgi:hypothetical protein
MAKCILGLVLFSLYHFWVFGQDSINVKDLRLIKKLESCIYAVKGYRHSPNQYIVNGIPLTYEQVKEKLMQCEQSKIILSKHPYSFKAIYYYNYYYNFNGDSLVNAKQHRTIDDKLLGENRYGEKRDLRTLRRAVRRFNESLSR